MDIEDFRKYLMRLGKKTLVISTLAHQVDRFELWLMGHGISGLNQINPEILDTYLAEIEDLEPGKARIYVRGIGLYYKYIANQTMYIAANNYRGKEIEKNKNQFKLKDFMGVSLEDIHRLSIAKIVNTEQMLKAGSTPEKRIRLMDMTGIPYDRLLELVKLSELSRLPGLKGKRARLYYDGGFDTLEKISSSSAEHIRNTLIDFVNRTGFDGIAPLPKEIQSTMNNASQLTKIVTFSDGEQ